MTKNYFESLLDQHITSEEEVIKDSSKKIKESSKPYNPNASTLNKLTQTNHPLALFLSVFSPFIEGNQINEINHVRFGKGVELKKIFPIKSSALSRLRSQEDEVINIILQKWREGVTNTILEHADLLKSPSINHIKEVDLVNIFLEPTIWYTKQIITKQFVSSEDLIQLIAFNAGKFYEVMNPSYRWELESIYKNMLKDKNYTIEHINHYNSYPYKFLDNGLLEAFESKNYRISLEVLRYVESYLDFVEIPKEVIIEKAKSTLEYYSHELVKFAEEFEESKLLMKSEAYKLGTYGEKTAIRKKVSKSSYRYNNLKRNLTIVLEVFAKL